MMNSISFVNQSGSRPTMHKPQHSQSPIDASRVTKFIQQQMVSMASFKNPKDIARILSQQYLKMNMLPFAKSVKGSETKKQTEELANRQILHLPSIVQVTYTYYLGKGNNHDVVHRVLQGRSGWVRVGNSPDITLNLQWQQSSKGYHFDRLGQKDKQLVNHFQNHGEITEKDTLYQNLINFCTDNEIDVYGVIPITFVLDFKGDKADILLLNFLHYYENNAPDNLKYKQEAMKKFFNIRRVLGVTIQHQEVVNILKTAPQKSFTGPDYVWILKPTSYNRGRGVHVFKDLDMMTNLIDKYLVGRQQPKDGGTIKARQFVIQKYLEQPLLIKNRKFDIRVWCMVTGNLQCFFFKEGYIRLASEEYCTTQVTNSFVHLTNNAIQKFSQKYGQFEDGNQMSFDQAAQYLAHKGDFQKNVIRSYNQIVDNIKRQAYLAFCSVYNKLNTQSCKHCFEIFGLDFMVDNDFKVWLIEVNTNPCLEESSLLLSMLIPRMLDDAFKLTIDQVFPTANPKVYPVAFYSDKSNMWTSLGMLNRYN